VIMIPSYLSILVCWSLQVHACFIMQCLVWLGAKQAGAAATCTLRWIECSCMSSGAGRHKHVTGCASQCSDWMCIAVQSNPCRCLLRTKSMSYA
jgi:hypothetical protein